MNVCVSYLSYNVHFLKEFFFGHLPHLNQHTIPRRWNDTWMGSWCTLYKEIIFWISFTFQPYQKTKIPSPYHEKPLPTFPIAWNLKLFTYFPGNACHDWMTSLEVSILLPFRHVFFTCSNNSNKGLDVGLPIHIIQSNASSPELQRSFKEPLGAHQTSPAASL